MTASEDAASGRREYKVPAAEKALDILEFMAAQREDVTQTELSAGLGRSIHEIYRIIQLLEKRGFLVRTNADRYRLSLRLFELAHMHPPVNRLIDSALPVMRRLVVSIDQSCHLVVLRGIHALIILQIDSPLPMRYSVALGSQFPMMDTSSGAVLLAAMPAGEREAVVNQILAASDAHSRESIESRVRQVMALGHEIRPSLVVEGCTNISLPIHDHIGETVAALTVPYIPQRLARYDAQAVFRSTQAAALEISRALGAPENASVGGGARSDIAAPRPRGTPRMGPINRQRKTP